jgi:hypothetical protein
MRFSSRTKKTFADHRRHHHHHLKFRFRLGNNSFECRSGKPQRRRLSVGERPENRQFRRGQCYSHSFLRFLNSFCEKKSRVFLKKRCYDPNLPKLAAVWTENANFRAKFLAKFFLFKSVSALSGINWTNVTYSFPVDWNIASSFSNAHEPCWGRDTLGQSRFRKAYFCQVLIKLRSTIPRATKSLFLFFCRFQYLSFQ